MSTDSPASIPYTNTIFTFSGTKEKNGRFYSNYSDTIRPSPTALEPKALPKHSNVRKDTAYHFIPLVGNMILNSTLPPSTYIKP